MFQKFSNSLALVKIAFSYILQEGELFVYALLSFISSAIVFASLVGIDIFYIEKLSNSNPDQQKIIEYSMLFACYIIFYFITFFFNTAIITSVKRKLEGKENKFGDGIRDSMANLWKIFQWSIVSATVAIILRVLEDYLKGNFIWQFIVKLMGGAWSILTFFAFPIMIVNGSTPLDAIRESTTLFKKTWGERAIISVGSSFFYSFLMVFAAIFSVGIMVLVGIYTGVTLLVLSFVTLIILNSLTDSIINTILLHYASTETVPTDNNERLAFASIAKAL